MNPRPTSLPAALLISLAAAITPGGNARAQCENPTWLPGEGVPGVGGWIGPGGSAVSPGVFCSVLWDPDGAGPLPQRLVIGGDFVMAGDTPANSVAMWDGTTWLPLGNGIPADHSDAGGLNIGVVAMAVLPKGNLVVAGGFTFADDVPVNSIAVWDGTSWADLGGGFTYAAGDAASVLALAVLSNGDLVAGGGFEVAGGTAANSIARWNGASWSAMGNGLRLGVDFGECAALAVRPNGHLVAGGAFDHAGAAAVNSIARWNGTGWAAYGAGVTAGGEPGYVGALAVQSNGDVLVGGAFDTAGPVPVSNLARYNGSAWFDYASGGTNPEAQITRIIAQTAGNVLVDGVHLTSVAGVAVAGGARWDGAAWQSLDLPYSPDYPPLVGVMPNGEFVGWDGPAGHVVHGTAAPWTNFNSGFQFPAQFMAAAPNGDVFVAADYAFGGSMDRNTIVRWDGSSFHPLGSELQGYAQYLVCKPNGDLVAAERFSQIGLPTVHRVMLWNGSLWAQVGGDFGSTIESVAVMTNGNIVAGGSFLTAGGTPVNRLAEWNGTAWQDVGGGVDARVDELDVRPNGDLVVCGVFNVAGGNPASKIAIWNGTAWDTLQGGLSGDQFAAVDNIAIAPNGDVAAAGRFFLAGNSVTVDNIAKWDGTTWTALGPVSNTGHGYFDLRYLANGDLIVGSTFNVAFGDPVSNIARWDGTSWGAVGSLDGIPYSIVQRPNGDVVASGDFYKADGQVSAHFAVYSCSAPTCPSDFDNDGFVTGDDFDGYVAAFELGDIAADFDHDGFVTGDDFDAYVLAFEAGC